MSILSDAMKSATKVAAKTATPKSKTNWAAGPVETVDPEDGKPMLVGLVQTPPYGLMVRVEGAFKPRQLGIAAARRFAAGLVALDK